MADVAQTALVFDARPAQQGAQQFQVAGEKIIAANRQVEASFGITTNRVVTSISTQTRQLDSLARKFDPLGAAVRKASADLATLQRIAAGSGENAERAATMISAAQKRLADAQNAMAQAQTRANQTSAVQTQQAEQQGSAFAGLTTRTLAAAAAVVGFGLAVRAAATQVATAGDEIRTLTARMNTLTGATQGSKVAFDLIFGVAQRTGIALQDAAAGFSRFAIAASDIGASTGDIARVTETIAKLAAVGGASAQETTSAIQQLGQALASGQLQGDELRSLRENAPLVARAIAAEFKTTIGGLKQLGEEGKLTSDRVFKALKDAAASADAQFKDLPPTLERAGERGKNAFKLLLGALDETLGVSKLLAGGLDATAERAATLAARIRGDINLALADTIAKINELQGAADRLRKEAAAGAPDKPPGVPDSWVPDGRRPGQSLGITGSLTARPQGTSLTAIERQIAEQQDRLLRQRQEASSLADAEMQEADRLAREAAGRLRSKQTSDATKLLQDLRDKADPATKALREFKTEKDKLDAALKAGVIDQKQYNQGIADARKVMSSVGQAAKDTAESIKALNDVTNEANFTKKMADAAYQGAAALAQIEADAKAADKALEIFNKRNPTFEKKYSAELLATRNSKLEESFRTSTLGIERENKLLEAQLRLVNEKPEVVAREIAALKVRNDIQEKGLKLSQDDIDRRIKAAETAELLNLKIEEAKKQQEAMAEPFKNAIQSLQSYIVEGLTGGFKNAGQAIKGIWTRLMAELAVATVIRPIIIQPLVSMLGSTGLVPQSVVSQYGGGPIGSILGGGGAGGGGLGSLLGGGFGTPGGGSLFGGLSNWLNTPFTGNFAGISPAAMEGVIPGMSGGDALSYFGQLPGQGVGITPGGVVGGLGQFAMGTMNALRGGASTVQRIGGGMQAIGGMMSMVPGPVGWVGMGIAAIGTIMNLIGGKKPKTPQAVSNVRFGADGQPYSELAMARAQGANRKGVLGAGDALSDTISDIARLYDLQFASDATGGYILNSQGKNTGDQWIAGLGRYGGKRGGEFGATELASGLKSDEDAINIVAGAIFKRGAEEGKISGAGYTETIATILKNATLDSVENIKKALDFAKVYDDLKRGNENITAAEKAVRDLNQQFKALSMQAEDYGLSVDIIAQRQREAINKLATDANDEIRRRALGMTPEGQLQVALEDFDKARDAWIKNAEFINQTVTGTLVDIAAAEAQFGKERLQIIEQANEQANASLKEIWKRLSYGDLSGASPITTLTGARGTYEATLAQAQAGSLKARADLAGAAQDFITAQIAYTGNNAAFEAVRLKILEDIAPWVAGNDNGSMTEFNTNVTQMSTVVLSLQHQVETLVETLTQERAQSAALREEMRRVIALLPNAA